MELIKEIKKERKTNSLSSRNTDRANLIWKVNKHFKTWIKQIVMHLLWLHKVWEHIHFYILKFVFHYAKQNLNKIYYRLYYIKYELMLLTDSKFKSILVIKQYLYELFILKYRYEKSSFYTFNEYGNNLGTWYTSDNTEPGSDPILKSWCNPHNNEQKSIIINNIEEFRIS